MKYAKKFFIYRVTLLHMNFVIVPYQKNNFFVAVEMKYLLCSLHCIRENVLKKHYVDYHLSMIKIFSLKIFSYPIQLRRRVEFAMKLLKVQEVKKSTCFFFIMENIGK